MFCMEVVSCLLDDNETTKQKVLAYNARTFFYSKAIFVILF